MNGVIVNCDQCNWTAHAPDADLAVHWGNLHQQQVHARPVQLPEPLSGVIHCGEFLQLADAILDQWVSEDAARDAETNLRWLNTLTIDDAAFLIDMQILPN